MSNEELVAVIQAGENRMGELWEQVDGLVKWKAKQVIAALCGRCGVDFDDLYQSGYPALVAAVESYEPERGAFSTWFLYHLKRAFSEATGYRTKSGRNEPLNNSISLDTPLSDDSDSDTMMEVVADPNGQRPTQSVEEAIFHQQLHEALEASLSAIPEQSAEILRLRYYHGLTLAEVGDICGTGVERIRQMESKALRQIRKPSIACHLRPFYDFDFYCGTGLGAFRNSGLSIQERYLMIEEGRAQKRRELEKQQREQEQQRFEQSQQEAEEAMERLDCQIAEMLQELSPEARELLEKRHAELWGNL